MNTEQDEVIFVITDLFPESAKSQGMHTTSARDFEMFLPLSCRQLIDPGAVSRSLSVIGREWDVDRTIAAMATIKGLCPCS